MPVLSSTTMRVPPAPTVLPRAFEPLREMHRRRQAVDAGADDDVVRVVGKRGMVRRSSDRARRRSSSSARQAPAVRRSASAIARRCSMRAARAGSPSTGSASARILVARSRRRRADSPDCRARAPARTTSVRPSASVDAHARPALGGKAARELGVLGERHRPRAAARRADRRAPAALDFGGADVAEDERRGDRKRQAVLRLVGRRRHRGTRDPRSIASRKLSIDERRDVVRGEAMRALQRERRLDRRLRPAADRIGLEVLLANAPARAEIAPRSRARRRARS